MKLYLVTIDTGCFNPCFSSIQLVGIFTTKEKAIEKIEETKNKIKSTDVCDSALKYNNEYYDTHDEDINFDDYFDIIEEVESDTVCTIRFDCSIEISSDDLIINGDSDRMEELAYFSYDYE